MTTTEQETNPFAQLGLPATWQPAPSGYTLAKVGIQTPAGVTDMHMLIIDGPTGRQAFCFGEEEIRALANKILEQTSGLTVAAATEMPSQWKEFK